MMNISSGNVTTDELGLATVTLPSWFEGEKGDFRYQLTVNGGRFAQAVVSKEIENNQFTISTNATNVKVSWQVTAVRQDAFAKAHSLVAEQEKPANGRGFYMHPSSTDSQSNGRSNGRDIQYFRQRRRRSGMPRKHAGLRESQARLPSQPRRWR
jgi:hypothetical protein